MKNILFAASANGLIVCERQGETWRELRRTLTDQRLTSVIAREGVILAGSRAGVFRSDDLGETWREASNGLKTRYVRWMAFHPEISDFEFAGTEPAGIFISRNGGESWKSSPDVTGLRDAHGWYLPYSPEAGCIRGFAFHGRRIYAAAEVGGALRSDDEGKNWGLTEGSSGDPHEMHHVPQGRIHPDVHSIAVHPESPELVYAPTGGGFYRSRDGGKNWKEQYDCYCRALWVDPDDPEHMVLGPADGVDRNGRIEVTTDGGTTWQSADQGLGTPWSRHMVERFYQTDSELYAVLSNGELLEVSLEGLEWKHSLPQNEGVRAVAVMLA